MYGSMALKFWLVNRGLVMFYLADDVSACCLSVSTLPHAILGELLLNSELLFECCSVCITMNILQEITAGQLSGWCAPATTALGSVVAVDTVLVSYTGRHSSCNDIWMDMQHVCHLWD